MGDTIWLRGESGVIFTLDQAAVTDHWYRRIKARELTQVASDGSPWTGAPVSPPVPSWSPAARSALSRPRPSWGLAEWQDEVPLEDPDDEPVLTLDTLRGYRSWAEWEHGTWVMRSHDRFPWPPGEWAQARCKACETAGRPVPVWGKCRTYGYGCGLYAASTPEIGIRGGVWGVLEATGRIVSHGYGFRAQYARPVALARPDQAGNRGEHDLSELRQAAKGIARAYGIPLLPAEQLEAEYPPDTG